MRLGSETGSIVNHFASRGVIGEPTPVVGMGATILHWTDRSAATITEVVLKKDGSVARIGVTQDLATRIDKNGMSEDQTYTYQPNPEGVPYWYGKNRAGLWTRMVVSDTGRWVFRRSAGLRIGERDAYHDFSF